MPLQCVNIADAQLRAPARGGMMDVTDALDYNVRVWWRHIVNNFKQLVNALNSNVQFECEGKV